MSTPEPILEATCRAVEARLGHVVPKFYVERAEHGLQRAQAVLKAPSLEATLARLESLPIGSPAWQSLIEAITVGETNFFRHREWFAEIKNTILVPLIEERRKRGLKRIDLWSAAASTGEEAYTLAILIDELLPDRRDWTIRIVASDINEAALATAREGIYRPWVLREVDPAVRAKEFTEIRPSCFQLSSRLRQMVEFKRLNLCADLYPDPATGFENFDLIICRNVLIYFTPAEQLAVASRLARSLAPGGWLAVSPAEATAQWYKPLQVVNSLGAIFFRNVAGEAAKPKTARKVAAEWRHRGAKPKPAAPANRAPAPAAPHQAAEPEAAPPVTGEALSLARVMADRGDYQNARQLCEAYVAAAGPDFDAYLLLATVCLESGDLRAGFEHARRAAYLDSESAAACYMLGTISYRQGAREVARRNMELVVKLLEAQPADAPVAQYFNATAGELRASARGYLGEPIVA
jgi:chemotaxis protein methyltransferase CheR